MQFLSIVSSFVRNISLLTLLTCKHRLSCCMSNTFLFLIVGRGVKQNTPRGNYQDFLKLNELESSSQNLQFEPPTIRHKRVLVVYSVAKFDKKY